MAKKIIPAVFAGIVLFGIVLGIVGFALGGRPGNFSIDGTNIVYREGGRQINIASIPRFWSDIPRWIWPFGRGANRFGESSGAHSGGAHSGGGGAHHAEAAAHPATPAQPVPVVAGELERLEIDVSAGYVVVQPGTEYSLSVQGDLPYEQEYKNGVWKLIANDDNIDVRGAGFFLRGKDVTTTFVLTVPQSFKELDLKLDMGEATVRDLSVQEAECITNMGSIEAINMTVDKAKFDVDMGSIEVANTSVRECEAICNMGSITLSGEVTEKLVAKCDMGSIEGTLLRPLDFGWDLEADLGSVTLGDHSASGAGSKNESNTDAATLFELECGLGSIDIQFADDVAVPGNAADTTVTDTAIAVEAGPTAGTAAEEA